MTELYTFKRFLFPNLHICVHKVITRQLNTTLMQKFQMVNQAFGAFGEISQVDCGILWPPLNGI